MENMSEESLSIDESSSKSTQQIYQQHRSRSHTTRSSAGSTSSSVVKRSKDISPCYVCGAKAHGYNFDQITCESCKAFFRRNALKPMDRFRCRNNNNCITTTLTRKRCKRCRLAKCFKVGMRKEWILSDEEKYLKREKIVRNRIIKQRSYQQTSTDDNLNLPIHESTDVSSQLEQSLTDSIQLLHMYPPSDQQLYQRQEYLLKQFGHGYQLITKEYPQPSKFADRNILISQTEDADLRLSLVKDLTRELTQMTTSRLLNYFNLIPEFRLLNQHEQKTLLFQNMLAVFMFHGALTYCPENNTFVDRTTADQPYDANYLLFVYGPKVYYNFIALARQLTAITYQNENDQQLSKQAHQLFLLLMIILLFSSPSQMENHDKQPTKMSKIQKIYVDLTCRYVHDQYGSTVGRRIFKKLVPLLTDLQKLCLTLANINLCEMAQEEDSTMISNRSHLNELQKENRAPSHTSLSADSHVNPLTVRSSPSILSNTHHY